MMTSLYYSRESRKRVPDPISIDWAKAIDDGDVQLERIVASLLYLITRADEEGRKTFCGMMFYIATMLQMEGHWHISCFKDTYEEMNASNVELYEFLMQRDNDGEKPSKPQDNS